MKEIERNIFISEEIFKNEYEYTYGCKKDVLVHFAYYNVKKDKESYPREWTYNKCLELARRRAVDGRYKNYQYLIYE